MDCVKGFTHRATEALRWLSMSTLAMHQKVFVQLWVHFFLATEYIHRNGYQGKVIFGFRLNVLNISFEMGMFSYQN